MWSVSLKKFEEICKVEDKTSSDRKYMNRIWNSFPKEIGKNPAKTLHRIWEMLDPSTVCWSLVRNGLKGTLATNPLEMHRFCFCFIFSISMYFCLCFYKSQNTGQVFKIVSSRKYRKYFSWILTAQIQVPSRIKHQTLSLYIPEPVCWLLSAATGLLPGW